MAAKVREGTRQPAVSVWASLSYTEGTKKALLLLAWCLQKQLHLLALEKQIHEAQDAG